MLATTANGCYNKIQFEGNHEMEYTTEQGPK